MKFNVCLQKEVWSDDRDPRIVIAWQATGTEAETIEAVKLLMAGLRAKHPDDSSAWEIVISKSDSE